MTDRILITGGTGFLGQAILTAAARFRWDAEFAIFSRDPMKQAAVRARFPAVTDARIGDVRDREALDLAFAGFRPDTVIHAAAMKHIPIGEVQAAEAVGVNVDGSRMVLHAARAAGVRRLVGVSSDKAVSPVNLYGATKMAMERLYAEAGAAFDTIAVTCVRYGNVVGSTGSVIPLWQRQAADQAEITLTDETMTRFWLGPFRAVALIHEALAAPSGSVTVPLLPALDMAGLATLVAPGVARQIIGSRSGEKLHEDLISSEESHRVAAVPNTDQTVRVYPMPIDKRGPIISYRSDEPVSRVNAAQIRHWLEDAAVVRGELVPA